MAIIFVIIFCPVFIIVEYKWNVDKNDDSEFINSQTNDRKNSYLADDML